MVKRELSVSDSASGSDYSPIPSTTPPSKKVKRESATSNNKKSPSTVTASPKTKLPLGDKRALAEEIIMKGCQAVDIDALMRSTGLTKQQIKSQLSPNRQNIRKQLMDVAKTLG